MNSFPSRRLLDTLRQLSTRDLREDDEADAEFCQTCLTDPPVPHVGYFIPKCLVCFSKQRSPLNRTGRYGTDALLHIVFIRCGDED